MSRKRLEPLVLFVGKPDRQCAHVAFQSFMNSAVVNKVLRKVLDPV
jgi:hypothetical protein